jgi:hypothetical protein
LIIVFIRLVLHVPELDCPAGWKVPSVFSRAVNPSKTGITLVTAVNNFL